MKRFFAMILALLMVISVLSMPVFAAGNEFNIGSGSCDYYNLIEKNDYNLAPGAVESEIIINDDSGSRRQVVHVIEVDPDNENISVMPSFKNISNDVDYTDKTNWGIMEMSKQSAYVENTLGKNVVGAMNVCLSWDFTHPYGLLLYEGKVLSDNRASCEACGKGHPGGGYLVIYKDGKAELRDPLAPLTGDEWMAQTVCFSFLVKNGVNQHTSEDHNDANGAPRSVIGVKADGTLVIMMVDGRMSPYSAGFTSHEMAQMMLDLGCVDAINCDGGGSSTFITEREGTGQLTVKSRFSDGSERPTLTGILVVSKAVADGKFDHASIEAENKLVTPGSTVKFTATGADSAGGPAEIPEEISWKLKDESMGTIEDGVFVSNGKVGEVTAQMIYNDAVVGEATIEVVIPDSFAFVMSNITAPYTKTVSLDVVAKYGYTEVALNANDVIYVLSDDAIGTIENGRFTATSDESVSGGTVTATLVHNAEMTAIAAITLGKASEIVYDFESGAESIANWYQSYKSPYTPDKYYFDDSWTVVTASEGKVRNGKYALKVSCEGDSITCMNWCQTRMNGLNIDLTDATSLSFWMYVPEGAHGYEWDFGNAIPVVLGHEFEHGTGWQYFTVKVADIGSNVTKLDQIKLYRSDTNNAANGYNHFEHPNYYADVTFYIDDITVNYSSAVEDNDAPAISGASVSHANVDTPVAMNGNDVDANVVAFVANATDNLGVSNFTGLDTNSLAVYVDGNLVDATCSDTGRITTGDIELANGVHTVVFNISDNNGNTNAYKEYTINIVGEGEKNTIKYVPADPSLKDVPNDSVVWMNLVATAIDKVSKVTMTIDLDQNNKWELDHMILANGFSATYTVDTESNDANIIITADGSVDLSGEAVIATLPIRAWAPVFMNGGGNEDASAYRLVSIMSYVQKGLLEETDSSVSMFASDVHTISTEWNSTRLLSADKDGWHIHTVNELSDVDATCTENGYTGRTYCEGCASVVDWGITVEAKGHSFGADGNCKNCDAVNNQNGLVEIEGSWYYLVNGVAQSGWQYVDGQRYYFQEDATAKAGEHIVDALYFETDKTGKVVGGVWAKTIFGFKYDTTPFRDGWLVVDGREYYVDHYYRLENGYEVIYDSNEGVNIFYFENGICDKNHEIADGFYQDRNGLAYVRDGKVLVGLQEIDGDYYYFAYNGYAVTGAYAGYVFGDDYKAVNGLLDVDGTLCYYENGKPKMAGLVEIDGDLYFAYGSKGQVAIGECYVWQGNGLLPNGTYEFDQDGKIINGIHNKNGTLCYYKNGQPKMAGLVEVDGDLYFAYGSKGQVAIGECYVWQGNDLLPNGTYEFGADGKLLTGVVDKNGVLCYYENGQPKMAGLVEINGDYYFAYGKNGEVAVGETYVWNANGIELENPNCEFGADGKMLNGIVEKDGVLHYYVMGRPKMAGLIEIDGDYYFAYGKKGELAIGETYVWNTNGIELENNNCEFGADGKMLNGIVEKDGVLHYYVMGRPKMAGLIEIDGDYYFAYGKKGELAIGETYVWNTNGIELKDKNCEFGTDGKMLNGIVEKNGQLYYYEMGCPKMAGLIEIDGDYYFANGKDGAIATGSVYVWETNGIMPEDTYAFDDNGKMLDGFVTVNGELCYYETGKYGQVGLNYIDGNYYFVDYGGKVWTNGTFYVWDTNDLSIGMKYTFDETGKIIK